MKIDDEDPAVDIFQLKKAGGSKGSGTKLVPVIPTVATDPKFYRRNARRWLTRVLDASVAADISQYDSCFLLCKALERMDPQAVADVWRTTAKQSFKMDIHRQLAMTDTANLTYSQLRVIRPFFIADRCNPLHSEHEVRKHEIKSCHGDPIFIQFKEEQYSRNGWYLPVDAVIEAERGTETLENSPELHVILSADHDQGH